MNDRRCFKQYRTRLTGPLSFFFGFPQTTHWPMASDRFLLRSNLSYGDYLIESEGKASPASLFGTPFFFLSPCWQSNFFSSAGVFFVDRFQIAFI